MKNPLFYLLITLYALTACSNGEDYREPKSEEDLSGLVLAASNGSYYQQKYENAPMCNFSSPPAKQMACRLCGKGTPMSMPATK